MPERDPFLRRARWYARLDQQWAARTRFFAAAALTNQVLDRLFRWLPVQRRSSSYRFLGELGAALEVVNLQLTREARAVPLREAALDAWLVCEEQHVVQAHWKAWQRCAGSGGDPILSELNGWLNGHSVAWRLTRHLTPIRQYCAILGGLRRQLGTSLNFAEQAHRVHIGMALIAHIRTPATRGS